MTTPFYRSWRETEKNIDRNKRIYYLRRDGATLKEIGRRMDLSSERVRQICLREKKRIITTLNQATFEISLICQRRLK